MNSAKMHANNVQVVQIPPSAKEAGVLNPNTGFPEPLSPDRNTTLPHPDADTSKNATIEAADVELTRTRSRNRFLHSRHGSYRSVTSKGKLDPAEVGLYDNIVYADGSKEKDSGAKMAQKEAAARNGNAGAGASASANGNSAALTNGEAKEEAEGRSTDEILRIEKERDEQGYLEGERKKGVLRKLHLHKV